MPSKICCSVIKPNIVHAALSPQAPPPCVPLVRANKCCQVNVDYAADLARSLFAHGQMTRRDHSLWVVTGLAHTDVQAGSVSTQTLFLQIQRWSVCWRLNLGSAASTVSEGGGKSSRNTVISRSPYTGEIGAR